MHPKVFVKLNKTLKTLSSGQKTQKNPKKPKKKPKKPKKNHWAGFFLKNPGFFQPCVMLAYERFCLSAVPSFLSL